MLLRTWWVATITLTALLLGTSFAHLLELPAKMRYDAELYVRLQTSLYTHWGPPGVGGFLEPAAILAVIVLAALLRHDQTLRRPVVGAAIGLLLAFPAVFFWRVAPANAVFWRAASSGVIPPDWAAWRLQWETGHALRFALHLTTLVLLAAAAVERSAFGRSG